MERRERIRIPPEVALIAEKLEAAGYETWCVGGAVRDFLLGDANQDFDLATAATPDAVRRLFRRTVPVGIEHGTVAVLDRAGGAHEVTTFRRDIRTDGRHAVVEFGASLDDDLARRDFTVNAIAYHPLRHVWYDGVGGTDDVEAGVIRAVGDPEQRFREDFLRILRALRFAARFDFRIEELTWRAARHCVEGLRRLSAERVRDEWFKGLATARAPSRFVRDWHRVGAAAIWLPELEDDEGGPGYQALDRMIPADPVLVTSYLSDDPGATLKRLRCSNAEIARGRNVRRGRGPLPDPTNAVAVRRWMADVGPALDDLLRIAAAEDPRGPLREAVRDVQASGAPLTVSELAVSGDDLLRAGVPRGPAVGRLLRQLLDAAIADPRLNTRDALLRRAEVLRGGEEDTP